MPSSAYSLCRPWTEAGLGSEQVFISDYSGGWVQGQARDTYLCTNCYVWDDAVERKVDISTVWALCQSNSDRRGREPPTESQRERWSTTISVLGDPPSFHTGSPVFTRHTSDLGHYPTPVHPTTLELRAAKDSASWWGRGAPGSGCRWQAKRPCYRLQSNRAARIHPRLLINPSAA